MPELLHDHLEVGHDGQTHRVKVQKRLLNTDILSVFERVNTPCVISTSLLCFKGGCCWFRCYFWQIDWLLVGTSLPLKLLRLEMQRGAQSCPLGVCPPEHRAGSVWRLALPGSSALRAAGLLCPSLTPTLHFLLHPFLSLAISRLSQCGRWISHPDHTKTNHISSVWLVNARAWSHFGLF